MANDQLTIVKIIKILKNLFPNSEFTGIQRNLKQNETFKYRGYLIAKIKKEMK
jgi:hypothetical protein